jgi:hypothetical protein
LKFSFLPFVVVTIVATVFFFAVFAARAPAMGNSADRAWQLSQLVEGVLTAFNPSHGSLSCVQARRCVSKQIGRHDAACQGCPQRVSRSPEARCLRVLARAVRVSQPAVLSALLVIQLFGIVIPPPNFSKERQKERCGHFSVAALLHYVLWCASEYSVVGRLFCYVLHDNVRTNVCQWSFAEKFFLLPFLMRWIFQRRAMQC